MKKEDEKYRIKPRKKYFHSFADRTMVALLFCMYMRRELNPE